MVRWAVPVPMAEYLPPEWQLGRHESAEHLSSQARPTVQALGRRLENRLQRCWLKRPQRPGSLCNVDTEISSIYTHDINYAYLF